MTSQDCGLLARLGLAPGYNNGAQGGAAWLGSDGPFTFEFTNHSPGPVTLVFDTFSNLAELFDKKPTITYSLPNPGDKVTVSAAQGVSGTFGTVNPQTAALHKSNLLDNTIGEFSNTGVFTFDVSREINMHGSKMAISSAACKANMNVCVFKCKNNMPTCGKQDTYDIDQTCPGADKDQNGQTGGGCKDFNNIGRHVQVSLG